MGSDFKEIIDKSNWIKKKVVEVADVNQYSLSGKEKIGKIKYIEISEVNKGKVNKLSKIDFSSAPSRARRVVRNNDILISTVRPNLEHYAFLKNVEKKTIASTGFAVITAKDIEPRFLYYVLSSPRYTEYFSTIAAGHTSAYPAMNPDVIEQVEIPFPPLEEQKRIAHILGTLDDKIELNQRMNETLEAMARALFKAWFVDFEPVKAKMNGEPYPLPEEIMNLFPDELVESELGLIPRGWRVGIISDFGKIVCGKTPPKSNSAYYGGEIPFIKIPDMHKSVFITKTSDTLTKFGADFQKSKYLPPFSIMVSCIASVGLVSLTSRISQTNQQINAIIPNNVEYCYYVYYSMINISDHLKALGSTGSATLNVNTSEFSKIYVLLPKDDLAIAFYKIVDPFFRIIMRNEDVWQYNQTINVLLGNLFS